MTSDTQTPPQGADINTDALREKYRKERDKRLRVDGNEQYIQVKDEFAHFLDDPYAPTGFEREALNDEVEVLIIGGGFGGLLAGARGVAVGVRARVERLGPGELQAHAVLGVEREDDADGRGEHEDEVSAARSHRAQAKQYEIMAIWHRK